MGNTLVAIIAAVGICVLILVGWRILRRLEEIHRLVDASAYPVFKQIDFAIMERELQALVEEGKRDPENSRLRELLASGDSAAARSEADQIVERMWRTEQIHKKLAFMTQANIHVSTGAATIESIRREWNDQNPLLGSLVLSLHPELRKRQEEEWRLLEQSKKAG